MTMDTAREILPKNLLELILTKETWIFLKLSRKYLATSKNRLIN